MRRRPAAAAVAAALALAAGCGGGGAPSPAPPPDRTEKAGSGYFVGTAPGGLGATVDLLGTDAVVRALGPVLAAETAPGEPSPSVGIASVVNDSSRLAPMPAFVAVLASGRRVALEPAADALRGRDDAAARRAAALLPPVRSAVPGGGSAVDYVVLRGVVPGRVAEVRMTTGPEASTRLAPRPR